ncbi:MAG: 50S ribosomal protein L24 [Thermoanaerobaculia bacterium]
MFGKTSKKKVAEGSGKAHVHKDDLVQVTAGRDRGKQGKVLRVNPAAGTAVVEHVNFVKKHERKNPSKNQQGGILEREAPIAISNLKVVCSQCGQPTRMGSKEIEGQHIRTCKKCGAELG